MGYAARREDINAYKILIGKRGRKRTRWIFKWRYEHNIKMVLKQNNIWK
jgi:hypothetical protein